MKSQKHRRWTARIGSTTPSAGVVNLCTFPRFAMRSQSSPQLISNYKIVPTLNAIPFDTPMNRRPFISRRRSIPGSSHVHRYNTIAVLFVLHCFMLQFDLNCIARAADSDVVPFVQVHYTASQRMNHERMNSPSRFLPIVLSPNSEADSEVRWSRRTQETVAACSAYPACAAAGLVNDCCPTSQGVFLGCCDVTSSPGSWSLSEVLHTRWFVPCTDAFVFAMSCFI